MIKYKRLKSWVIFYAPILIDLCVIIILGIKFLDFGTERIFFFDLDILNNKKLLFVLFSASSWLVSTYLMNFYKTDRNSTEFRILTLILKQFLLFLSHFAVALLLRFKKF